MKMQENEWSHTVLIVSGDIAPLLYRRQVPYHLTRDQKVEQRLHPVKKTTPTGPIEAIQLMRRHHLPP